MQTFKWLDWLNDRRKRKIEINLKIPYKLNDFSELKIIYFWMTKDPLNLLTRVCSFVWDNFR